MSDDMSGWQPIETAPKDGTVVIVWPPTWNAVTSCAYWVAAECWWARLDLDGSIVRPSEITHWRPVLTGPNGEKP